MNTKMPAILAGGMIAFMALAPMVMAHDASLGNNRVSGRYVGAAGPWVQLMAEDVDTGEPAGVVNPGFALAFGNALCDLEVLSDGSANGQDGDEPFVDQGTGAGTIPEGTFDDGGQGALCHTPDTHYLNADFNTQQCDYTPATGSDDNWLGNDNWLSTACDFRSTVVSEDDPTPLDPVLGLPSCVVNAVISADLTDVPAGELALAAEAVACVGTVLDWAGSFDAMEFFDCMGVDAEQNGNSCPPGSGGYACGPDGTADDGNSGKGSLGVPFPSTGVCASTDGVAAVFVWDAVVVDNDPSDGVDYTGVYVATTGSVA